MQAGGDDVSSQRSASAALRALIVTYEYAASRFSGNGVYAGVIARALRAAGFSVRVAAARPSAHSGSADDDAEVLYVVVPARLWGSLSSRHSAHAEFSVGLQELAKNSKLGADLDLVLFVDWHASPDAIKAVTKATSPRRLGYLNFRVFSRSGDDEDRAFYEAREGTMLRCCNVAVALNQSDLAHLKALPGQGPLPAMSVLFPPVRRDILEAAQDGIDAARRRLVLCAVRLSREKEAHRFVEAVCEPSTKLAMVQAGWVPAVIASPVAASSEYAAPLLARLRAEWGGSARVVQEQLDAAGMAALFECSALNVHPPLADAFGMTCLEAAACGTPTLLHGGRDDAGERLVGAGDALQNGVFTWGEEAGVVTHAGADVGQAIATIAAMGCREREGTIQRAQQFARFWDEAAFRDCLKTIID